MALLTNDPTAEVKSRILSLRYPSIVPESVDVIEGEGSDGEGVRVVVRFADADGGNDWTAEDFLRLRRDARDIAYQAYRILENLHLSYVSADDTTDLEDQDVRTNGQD